MCILRMQKNNNKSKRLRLTESEAETESGAEGALGPFQTSCYCRAELN